MRIAVIALKKRRRRQNEHQQRQPCPAIPIFLQESYAKVSNLCTDSSTVSCVEIALRSLVEPAPASPRDRSLRTTSGRRTGLAGHIPYVVHKGRNGLIKVFVAVHLQRCRLHVLGKRP